MRTWIVAAALLVASIGAQADHFGWRSVTVGGEEHGIVASHNMDMFEISTFAGGFSPARRAEIIAGRLEEISQSHDMSPRMFTIGQRNGLVILQHQEHTDHSPHIIATIDPELARKCLGSGGSAERLAQWRLALLRDHMSLAAGVMPVYTSGTRIGDTFRNLFAALDTASGPVRSEDIASSVSRLSSAERAAFRNAACTIPASFDPIRVPALPRRTDSHSDHEAEADAHPNGNPDHHAHGSPDPDDPDSVTPSAAERRHTPSRPRISSDDDYRVNEANKSRAIRSRKSGDYSVELLTDSTKIPAGKTTSMAVRITDTHEANSLIPDAAVRVWLSRKGERSKRPVGANYNQREQAYTFEVAPDSPGDYSLVVGVLAGADAAFNVEFPVTIEDPGEPPIERVERPVDLSSSPTQHHGDFDITLRRKSAPLRVGEDALVEVRIDDTTSTEPDDRPVPKLSVIGWFVSNGRGQSDVAPRKAASNLDMPQVYGWTTRFSKPGRFRLVVEVEPPNADSFTVEFRLQVLPQK